MASMLPALSASSASTATTDLLCTYWLDALRGRRHLAGGLRLASLRYGVRQRSGLSPHECQVCRRFPAVWCVQYSLCPDQFVLPVPILPFSTTTNQLDWWQSDTIDAT